MQALVVYDSQFGHTEQIANAIVSALAISCKTRVVSASQATPSDLTGYDLLVVGGPTQAHGMRPALLQLLEGIVPEKLSGVAVAAFDTRIRGPRWLWGSAAVDIAERLHRAGGQLALPPESFYVGLKKDSPLRSGELDRASAWARTLLAACTSVAARKHAPS